MVFYLFGPDTYRSKQKLTDLKNKFLTEIDPTGINLTIADSNTLTAHSFKQIVLAIPFLSKRRMVVIKNLFSQKLSTGLEATIINYLNHRDKESCEALLIFYQDESNNKQSKVLKELEKTLLSKSDHSQEFKTLTDKESLQWVSEEAKSRHKPLLKTHTNHLVKTSKNDLWNLSNKLDQLIAYLNNNKDSITQTDLNNLIGCLDDDSTIWQLIDAALNKNYVLFSELVEEQATKENYQLFLREYARNIKLLLLIKIYFNKQLNVYDLGNIFSYPAFVIKKGIAYAEKFKHQELIAIHNSLLQIDRLHKKQNLNIKSLLSLYIGGSLRHNTGLTNPN